MANDGQLYSANINEHTFLLCKPDVSKMHRHILQVVSEAGFQVQAKSFCITANVAEELVAMFPSVQQRLAATAGATRAGAVGQAAGAVAAAVPSSAATSAAPAAWAWTRQKAALCYGEPYAPSPNASTASAALCVAPRQGAAGHRGTLEEIRLLTTRHRETDTGVNAGLSGTEADSSAPAGIRDGHTLHHSHADGGTSQASQRRVTATAALKSRQLETLPYEELVRAHVAHLTGGGTCLAVILSGPRAVEKLLEMVGPENPADARRVAPSSLRATLGVDLVHNAVHAASNLSEANACVTAVFGYEPQCSSAGTSAEAARGVPGRQQEKSPQAAAGAEEADGKVGSAPLRPAAAVVMRPALEAVRLPSLSGTHVTLSTILPAPSSCRPEALLSYYRGGSPTRAAATATALRRVGSVTQRAQDTHVLAQDATQVPSESPEELLARGQRETWAERQRLAMEGQLLHLREMDLLLREQALRSAAREAAAASAEDPHRPTKRSPVREELDREREQQWGSTGTRGDQGPAAAAADALGAVETAVFSPTAARR